MRLVTLLLSAAWLFAGCSTLETHIEPKTDLRQLKHVFVQQSLNDNHGLDAVIVRELQARGLQAESGPLTLMPPTATAYFIYEDHWDWDFRDYLLALNLTVRDARTDQIMATTSYFRPTAFLKSSADMVHITITALFEQPTGPRSKPATGGRGQ
jgi:hypothetical protein